MGETATFPEMTPKAAEAFAAYVALGPKRSLESLCARYRTATEPPPTKRLDTLKEWSSRYQWQHRIASAASALADARLEQAAELDAASFLRTSELIAETLEFSTRHNLDAVLAIRQAVRKPSPKGASVTVTVEVRAAAEKVAAELGVPVDVVLSETYKLAEAES